MYGDLLLDQLGVNFLGPVPLDPELLHMLTTFYWNALGSTLGWWSCHNNTVSCNEKFWVEQVTVPLPPPGKDKGGGYLGSSHTIFGKAVSIAARIVHREPLQPSCPSPFSPTACYHPPFSSTSPILNPPASSLVWGDVSKSPRSGCEITGRHPFVTWGRVRVAYPMVQSSTFFFAHNLFI